MECMRRMLARHCYCCDCVLTCIGWILHSFANSNNLLGYCLLKNSSASQPRKHRNTSPRGSSVRLRKYSWAVGSRLIYKWSKKIYIVALSYKLFVTYEKTNNIFRRFDFFFSVHCKLQWWMWNASLDAKEICLRRKWRTTPNELPPILYVFQRNSPLIDASIDSQSHRQIQQLVSWHDMCFCTHDSHTNQFIKSAINNKTTISFRWSAFS